MKSQTKTEKSSFGKRFLSGLSCLALLILLFSACQKSGGGANSSSLDVFGLTDETAAAGDIVEEANGDLKKIRKMYAENQSKVEDLKAAMNEKRVEDVKKIADELVLVINDGFTLGESAIAKIEKAEAMNINTKYKEYLLLKRTSLRKQLDAFEFRRQFAQLLRDGFGTKDKFEIGRVKLEFQDREENFQSYMEQARELSAKANEVAKEALRQEN